MLGAENLKAENEISTIVVDTVFHLYRNIGPGLLESAYEAVLVYKLEERGLSVRRQVAIPLEFEGVSLDVCYRADLIVDNRVLIELKSLDALPPVSTKQVLTYLKITNLKLGLLVNFGAASFDGCVKRFVLNVPH